MGKNKRNVSKLEADYREKIADYAISKNLKCTDAILVLMHTGCRPHELKAGVRVKLSADLKDIEFLIVGSKLNSQQKRGIRLRKISIKHNNNKYFHSLIDKLIANGNETINVTITSENSFSGYVAKISKRLWPRKKYHASAYSFRHSFATDLKNSNTDEVTLAQCMGHASTRSQLSYGRKRRGSTEKAPDFEVVTSAEPRKTDRLLRFKIKNKNKANLAFKNKNEVIESINQKTSPEAVSPPKKRFKM